MATAGNNSHAVCVGAAAVVPGVVGDDAAAGVAGKRLSDRAPVAAAGVRNREAWKLNTKLHTHVVSFEPWVGLTCTG